VKEKPILLRTIHILIIGIVSVIPIFFTKQFVFAFTPEKTFLFYILSEVISFLWIYLAINNVHYRVKWSPVIIAGLIFLFFYTFSGIISVSPEVSFWSSISRFSGLVLLYHIAAFVLVITSTVRERGIWMLILWSSVISSSIVALISYLGPFGLKLINISPQSASLMGNTSYEGTYLLLNIFLAILLFELTNKRIARTIIAFLIVLIIFCPLLFNTFNKVDNTGFLGEARAASLSLWTGFGLLALLLLTKFRHVKLRFLGIVSSSAIIFITILCMILIFVYGSVVNQTFQKEALGTRPILWNIAGKGIVERPLFGWGPENYFVPFYKHIDPALFSREYGNGTGANTDKPHNMYLEIFVTGGLVGILSYFAIFCFLFITLYKKKIPFREKAILVSLLFAYLLQNFFLFDTLTSYIMLAILISYIDSRLNGLSAEKLNHSGIYAYTSAILFVISFWIVVYVPFRGQTTLAHFSEQNIRERNYFYTSLSSERMGGEQTSTLIYLTHGALRVVSSKLSTLTSSEKASVLIDIENLRASVAEYVDQNPVNYQLILSLVRLIDIESQLYVDTKTREDLLVIADKYADKLVSLSPQNPQNYWEKAQRQTFEGKIKLAEKTLEEVISLYPEIKASQEMLEALDKYKRGQIDIPYFQY